MLQDMPLALALFFMLGALFMLAVLTLLRL
jgi:hypothetical protein